MRATLALNFTSFLCEGQLPTDGHYTRVREALWRSTESVTVFSGTRFQLELRGHLPEQDMKEGQDTPTSQSRVGIEYGHSHIMINGDKI